MKINKQWLTACLIGLAITACSKKELLRDEPRTTDNTTTEESTDVHPYTFTQDGISTVDIGEAKEVIMTFRHFNNAINNKVPGNFNLQYTQFKSVIQPEIGPTLSEKAKQQITDSITVMTDRLYQLVTSEATSHPASEGTAGYLVVSNDEQRMLDHLGVEPGQVIQKALMGALTLDKVVYYMQKALSADNSRPMEGKKYTEMEHYWDIAYGYLGTLDVDRQRLTALFLANYIEKEAVGMQGLTHINTTIYQAFYKGRKAISEKRPEEARKQMEFINDQFYRLFSLRAIYYLKESKRYLEKTSSTPAEGYFHSMGEALGFIIALPFAKDNQGKSAIDIDTAYTIYKELVGNEKGLWDVERLKGVGKGSIADAIQKITDYFPLS